MHTHQFIFPIPLRKHQFKRIRKESSKFSNHVWPQLYYHAQSSRSVQRGRPGGAAYNGAARQFMGSLLGSWQVFPAESGARFISRKTCLSAKALSVSFISVVSKTWLVVVLSFFPGAKILKCHLN